MYSYLGFKSRLVLIGVVALITVSSVQADSPKVLPNFKAAAVAYDAEKWTQKC